MCSVEVDYGKNRKPNPKHETWDKPPLRKSHASNVNRRIGESIYSGFWRRKIKTKKNIKGIISEKALKISGRDTRKQRGNKF